MYSSPPLYLREKAVSRLINVSVFTLQKHRQKRIGLPWTKLNGMVLYRYADIEAYLAGGKVV